MSDDTRSRPMTAETIHTCSYYCERPECIKRQRDELRDRMEAAIAQQPAAAQPDWEVAPPGATHYQPHQGAYYKRVSASEWYVWSRVEDRELLRWLPSPGTSDSAELVVRPADALAQQPAAVSAIQFALTDPEGMTFLRLWNEGEFDTLRREWPDAPSEVYVGANPLAAQHQEDRNG